MLAQPIIITYSYEEISMVDGTVMKLIQRVLALTPGSRDVDGVTTSHPLHPFAHTTMFLAPRTCIFEPTFRAVATSSN